MTITTIASIPLDMSGDELSVRSVSPGPIEEDYCTNMDAVVEALFSRYEMRRQDEMHWRLRHVLESAWKSGKKAADKTAVAALQEILKEGDRLGADAHGSAIGNIAAEALRSIGAPLSP